MGKEIEKVTLEMRVLVKMTQNSITENARTVIDQEDYERRYNSLVDRYEEKYKTISGFVITNYGTIDSCYTNVIITGEDGENASGFCYNNEGMIINSHVVGAVNLKH